MKFLIGYGLEARNIQANFSSDLGLAMKKTELSGISETNCSEKATTGNSNMG